MKENYFLRVKKYSPTRFWINNPTPGDADKLIEADPPVVYRMFNPVPPKVVDELLEKIPDFRRAYMEDALSVDEFKDFGPVALFRDSFVKGWTYMLKTIKERRVKIS